MAERNEVVKYIVERYYSNDVDLAAQSTQFGVSQIKGWLEGRSSPQKFNVDWMVHCATCPEFMIIAEYELLDTVEPETKIYARLSEILNGHQKSSGIYAFYDSMANLIYIGKSNGNLLQESYQQINSKIRRNLFPAGATQPSRRSEIVRYFSAYYVRRSFFLDYAKQVESLILRISKPVLNKNVGKLERYK